MEFIIVQPRLLAGSKFNLSLAPNRRMSFSQLLLESTSTSVPPSLARIRSDPRNLAVVPCACLMMPVTPPLSLSIVPSHMHCAYLSFYLHHWMFWLPLFANTVKIFYFHCSRKNSSILQDVRKKEVQSYPSRPPPLSITGPSLLGKDTHPPLPHLLKSTQLKSACNPNESTTMESNTMWWRTS